MTADDWRVWVLSLHRPARVDDEEIPPEVDLVPWWEWRRLLSLRHRAEVVRKPLADRAFRENDTAR